MKPDVLGVLLSSRSWKKDRQLLKFCEDMGFSQILSSVLNKRNLTKISVSVVLRWRSRSGRMGMLPKIC